MCFGVRETCRWLTRSYIRGIEIFWVDVAKRAPPGLHKESKAVKKSHKDLKKSWKPLVGAITKAMTERGLEKGLPRTYTEVSMCELWQYNVFGCVGRNSDLDQGEQGRRLGPAEAAPGRPARQRPGSLFRAEDYFQDSVQGKLSPNAGPFVEMCKAWLRGATSFEARPSRRRSSAASHGLSE